MIRRIHSLALVMLLPLLPSAALAQKNTTPSHPRPAPQVAGRFIDSDGTHLRLHYAHGTEAKSFIGVIQSTCMMPNQAKSTDGKPLDLSAIPLGTQMTAYYVRRTVGKKSENVIMAVRLDSVQTGSTLPQGVYIPCFKGEPQSRAPK